MNKSTIPKIFKRHTLYDFAKIFFFVFLLFSLGCKTIGPKTITQDRFQYGNALGNSWKSMLLINIVKTRYLDIPVFLGIGQIVSTYSLENIGNINAGIASPGGLGMGIGGTTSYTQTPTITYTPMMGNDFLESFLNPINPVKICALIQAGYDPDRVMKLAVASMNGLKNLPVILGSHQNGDADFFKALSLLSELLEMNAAGFRIANEDAGKTVPYFYFIKQDLSPEIQLKVAEVYQLLGLNPNKSEFKVVFSPLKGDGDELCMRTRSMKQILQTLSFGVEIPAEHIARKLVPPLNIQIDSTMQIVRIRSGLEEPKDAFVSVPYEGNWFWIDNQDHMSKDKFTFILFLFTLIDKGNVINMPALTIPTR